MKALTHRYLLTLLCLVALLFVGSSNVSAAVPEATLNHLLNLSSAQAHESYYAKAALATNSSSARYYSLAYSSNANYYVNQAYNSISDYYWYTRQMLSAARGYQSTALDVAWYHYTYNTNYYAGAYAYYTLAASYYTGIAFYYAALGW